MYKDCGLQVGLTFGVRPVAGKKFYLRLTVEKMRAFVVFIKKYLLSPDRSGTNFAAAGKCENQSEIINQSGIIDTNR